MYNSNNNLVENISFIFLLLNMGYFFIFRSGNLYNYAYQNISPASFLLGVILSKKIRWINDKIF